MAKQDRAEIENKSANESKSWGERIKVMFSRELAADNNRSKAAQVSADLLESGKRSEASRGPEAAPILPERSRPVDRTLSGRTETTRSLSSDDSSVASSVATVRAANVSGSRKESVQPDYTKQADSRREFPAIPKNQKATGDYSDTRPDKDRADPNWRNDPKFQPAYGKPDGAKDNKLETSSQVSNAAVRSNRTNEPNTSVPKEISFYAVSGSASGKFDTRTPYKSTSVEATFSLGNGSSREQIGYGQPSGEFASKSKTRDMDNSSRSVDAAKQSNLSPVSAEKSAAFERGLNTLTSPGYNKDINGNKIVESKSRGYDNRSERMEARLSI